MNIRPSVESLEGRALMAVSYIESPPGVAGNIAVIDGTTGDDRIVANGDTIGQYTVTINGVVTPLAPETRYLYIRGGDGNDTITNKTNLDSVLNGGAGNDRLVAKGNGQYVVDVLRGGTGKDSFSADKTDTTIQDPDALYPIDILGKVIFVHAEPSPAEFVVTDQDADTTLISVADGTMIFVPNYYKIVFDAEGNSGTTVIDDSAIVDPIII